MKTFLTTLLLAFIAVTTSAQSTPSFIPQPDNIAWQEGNHVLSRKTTISIESATLRPAADYLTDGHGNTMIEGGKPVSIVSLIGTDGVTAPVYDDKDHAGRARRRADPYGFQ